MSGMFGSAEPSSMFSSAVRFAHFGSADGRSDSATCAQAFVARTGGDGRPTSSARARSVIERNPARRPLSTTRPRLTSLAESSASASIAGSYEQRDRVTGNHRVAHTARVPLVARHRGDGAEGEQPDRAPVLEHRIRRISPGPGDVIHELAETEVGLDGYGLTGHQVAHLEAVEGLLGRDVAGFGGRRLVRARARAAGAK
jgi:hypothetical protein